MPPRPPCHPPPLPPPFHHLRHTPHRSLHPGICYGRGPRPSTMMWKPVPSTC
uniref:Uncharacterized protein n=1 Tax=Arundo donax TaxID=35708 RepID=A0A0A8YUH8_ARUDO